MSIINYTSNERDLLARLPEFATFIFKKIHKGLFFKSFSIAFFQFCVIIIVGR